MFVVCWWKGKFCAPLLLSRQSEVKKRSRCPVPVILPPVCKWPMGVVFEMTSSSSILVHSECNTHGQLLRTPSLAERCEAFYGRHYGQKKVCVCLSVCVHVCSVCSHDNFRGILSIDLKICRLAVPTISEVKS